MAQFQYRAVDPQGKVVEGTIEAAEAPVVVARLHDRGLIPLKVGAAAAGTPSAGRRLALPQLPSIGGGRVTRRDLSLLTQELSVLVSAGLPLDRCLATLAELADKAELKRITTEVLQAVRGGKSLAEALGQHSVFPPIYVNMVRAGELGGFLDAVLQRLAEYLERGQQLRDEVRGAIWYPIILTSVLSLAIVVLLVWVIPKFSVLFADMGDALPLPTKIVLALSNGLRGYWWAGVAFVGIVVVSIRYTARTPRGRYAWDQWQLRLPLLGPVIRKMEVAGLTRTLGTLLRSGVPMLQALGTVRAIVGNQVIAHSLGEVEAGAREGAGVADPLARSGVFPALAVQMISIGEETGRLDDMLLKVADHFDREVHVRILQFMRLLEPALILFMGAIVFLVVVAMFLAIFSVNDLPL